MDYVEIGQVISGFRERMTKLALFDPLFELQRKRQTDRQNKPIDFMELGLLSLLYFFEQKLMRNNKAGVKDLAEFLQKVTGIFVDMDDAGFEDLARQITQVFRPTTGKKRDFTFMNWESGVTEHIYISILKANAFDLRTNTQYYTLDEDGLELIFATKEFYTEFQLSIHQLVLRKQLEKGEFEGALRQINEMRIDVEALQERMIKLEHELKRNIVSEETFGRYKSLLEDIYLRLQMENEEFEELRQFVKETKDRVQAQTVRQADQRPYELILRISNELEKVHGEHSVLFHQSMVLKSHALGAAQESLYYTGLDSFNWDQDIASLIFSTPLPLETMKGVIAPFLPVQETKMWSLLTVWSEQNLLEDSTGQERDDTFLEIGGDSDEYRYQTMQKKLYKHLMELLLHVMEEQGQVEVKLFIEQFENHENASLLGERAFYDFWIYLHQRSPLRAVDLDTQQNDEQGTLLEDMYALLGNRCLAVIEQQDIIQVNDRFSIQNMLISWGEQDDNRT
ncbi:replicative DNA helicase [Paenibacillus qinlingensis]|uniref:replicative DNA helicase n=1 Tax=Paenibacillus qinlingensis TaxID=1837343 RepID=UPI001563BE9C|nr:replicative DNA helicase [Paenibacillus qinlingensis]NQX59512.1 replicative DNA helicase [Paenibacillus qinlingensis]